VKRIDPEAENRIGLVTDDWSALRPASYNVAEFVPRPPCAHRSGGPNGNRRTYSPQPAPEVPMPAARSVCVGLGIAFALLSGRELQAEHFVPPRINVPPGFSIELVAGPPLVEHPMLAGFDDRGRLYVAESAGENIKAADLLQNPPNRVLRLEDRDGDGRFDARTIFADRMTFPQGALWYNGAVYVASPPSIWKLEDRDDDGIAEVRTELVSKFGFTGNAADVHGCFLGPEGRIYWCDGRHGHDLPAADGRPARQGKAARVFSCKLDGSDVEIYCGGGMDNPVEVCFNDTGEMFGTMTFYNPDQVRHDALVHFVWGGVYPRHHACLAEFLRTGELLPALSLFGTTAPSGLMRYRSQTFGPDYQDNLFSAQFNTHKILRHVLERQGGTFRSRDEDFLTCESPDFHPTDVLEDADGSLLVIDTGGWFRIGCPTSQIAKPQVSGAIYRVRRTGSAGPTDPRGRTLNWERMPLTAMTELLADDRPAVRDRAIATLAQKGPAAVPALRTILNSAHSPLARQNAIWTCARIGTPLSAEEIQRALKDPEPRVRQTAARALCEVRSPAAVAELGALVANDSDLAVRREAATALGRIGQKSSVPALLQGLQAAGADRFLEHALIYALLELNDPDAVRPALADPHPHVRRAALIALDQMPSGSLTREEVVKLLDQGDPPLRQAVLSVVERRGWGAELVGRIETWLKNDAPQDQDHEWLRAALLAFPREPRLQVSLGEALGRNSTTQPLRLILLEAMARSEVSPLPAAWQVPLAESLRSSDPQVARQAVAAVAGVGGAPFRAALLALGEDSARPEPLRVAALNVWSQAGQALPDAAFALLLAQLAGETSALDRLAAAQALGRSALQPAQLTALAKILPQAGPLELPPLLSAWENPGSLETGKELIEALRHAPALSSLTTARWKQLWAKAPAEIQTLAAPLADKLSVNPAQQHARLEDLQQRLSAGRPEQGKELFFGRRTACFACHRVQGEGGQIGPDLSKIGEIRTRRDLLEAIVFPSASFARGFESYTVATESGQVHTGLIARETADAIYMRTTQRDEVRIPRGTIDELAPSPLSVMPQGLEALLSPAELSDLLSFLQSLK